MVVAICNKLEAEIGELDDDARAEFLADLGMEEPGLNRVIRAGYELLRAAYLLHGRVRRKRARGRFRSARRRRKPRA